MPVADAGAKAPGFKFAGGGDGQCRIEVRGIVQALAGAQVHAEWIAAAFAQPQRMQRKALPVIEFNGEFLRSTDMKSRHGRLH